MATKGNRVRDSFADIESFRPASPSGRLRSEWVADFRRNRWPDCLGISGRFASDYALLLSNRINNIETAPVSGMKADCLATEFAQCFLRLANLPNFALDRLSRYEATLWRQAGRILFVLHALDYRKPQERAHHFCVGGQQPFSFGSRE